ncbi:CoA ligase [Staphylococcus condimenti]|uniref:Putative long chain fatty acid-CoA ligase VraA n=1 Tax=Staphylococcus condimenti TaxID=70255 RepID=A0A4Q7CL79_9STAP|nr:AMP-binding protein [Staphylococcus condimenti]RZI01410.1 CoA ligase [Staphylococcus condimenti]RZI03771.1 CoA ligase [Staphylococcus condimenti]
MKDKSKVMVQTENSVLMRNIFERNLEKKAAYIEEWWNTQPQYSNQRIGISIADPAHFLTVYRAVQIAGKLPVVLDPKWTNEQFKEILKHYEITYLITDEKKDINHIQQLTLESFEEYQNNEVKLSKIQRPPEDMLHIGFTSGTTGMPKAYYRNRFSWLVSYDANDAILNGMPSSIIAPGPLAHSLTLYALMYAHHHSVPCYMQTHYHPKQLLQQLQDHSEAAVFLVPSILEQLLQFETEELFHIKVTFLTSGAKLEPHTIARFQEKLPHSEVIEFFGTSEASFISYHRVHDYQPHNVGQLFKGVTIKLSDDSGQELPKLTSTGQLHVQSDMVFSGYVDGMHVSAQDDIATGDYARMTENGDLILEGRVNNKCIIGGMNVYPEEVERVIMQNIPVNHVMVDAMPHYELGEVLIAYYESTETLAIPAVKKELRKHLERYKIPMRWIKVPHMRWTSSGKIARQAMKEEFGRRNVKKG